MTYYSGKYDDWLGVSTPGATPSTTTETRRRADALLLKYRALNAKLAREWQVYLDGKAGKAAA